MTSVSVMIQGELCLISTHTISYIVTWIWGRILWFVWNSQSI